MRLSTRRKFIRTSVTAAGAGMLYGGCSQDSVQPQEPQTQVKKPIFEISLAQWSLHRSIFGQNPGDTIGWDAFSQTLNSSNYRTLLAGNIDPLDFPLIAKRDYGINAVEYVNVFFFDRGKDQDYLSELKRRSDGEGVRNVLIMCDAEGEFGDPDEANRKRAVENHYKWVEAAKFLGCHSIRVNAASDPSLEAEEQMRLAADGLRPLCEFAEAYEINILVENHGGLSSNAQWLVGVMKLVDHPRIGTLPDFGNFIISETETYDRYKGIQELMPFAKSVSAKSYDFNAEGNETATDFHRVMRIVLDAGFRGWVGIEYEGDTLSEPDGIRATKALLERIREELSAEYS